MATVPIIVQANAGLPEIVNGQAIYNVDAEEFFIGVEKFVQLGASIIGGCCGTNPCSPRYNHNLCHRHPGD